MTAVSALLVILGAILLSQFAAKSALAAEAGVSRLKLALVILLQDGLRCAVMAAVVLLAVPQIFRFAQSDAVTFSAIGAAIIGGYWFGKGGQSLVWRLPALARLRAAAGALEDVAFRRRGYVRISAAND